jgi:serine/threonine protein kinase
MATESMSQFIEGLHASRLLESSRVEELLRLPESPRGDVDGMARFLEGQGWLTRFQIDEIRQGRGQGLLFAGYRLLEEIPGTPGGRRFKAHHPALQQAIVVTWVDPEWLAPADDPRSYVERARAASAVSHPNLVNIVDAGFAGETPYIVEEYVDGAKLDSLVGEMGALPTILACEYVRQAAVALQAAHERGVFHADLSPSRLMLAPVTRRPAMNGSGQAVVRPAAGAVIRVDGLGLTPRRPPLGEATLPESHRLGAVEFLPPERLSSNAADVRGDIYGLGATLYFLLAARPPLTGGPIEVLRQLPQATPPRIDALRKDVGAALADVIARALSKDPAARPGSAASLAQYLLPFSLNPPPDAKPVDDLPADAPYAVPIASGTDTRPNTLPAVMASVAPPMAEPVHEPLVEALPAGTRDSQIYSPVNVNAEPVADHREMFHDDVDDVAVKPRPLKKRPKVKGGWTWLILGLTLHVGALTVLILYLMGFFSSKSNDEPPPKSPPAKKAKK